MSDNEGNPVRLSQSWRMNDGVTIPAGTLILVTEEQERELREGGYLTDFNAPGYDPPMSAGPDEPDSLFWSSGPERPDEEFLDVQHDNPGS
jgi:hypothetical protein